MRKETRAKAKAAYGKLAEVYELLNQLMQELGNREDFAGYLLVQDARKELFGKGEALTKLGAVSTMGLKEKS